jgi:hypothetical protein
MSPAQTTSSVFSPGLALRPALDKVRVDGAALVEHALADPFLEQLRGEANAVRYEPLPDEEGRARQEGEIHVIRRTTSGYPAIDRLRTELVELVHENGAHIPGCLEWEPNETSIQRYHASALGITPHLDLKRYHYLVAIFTVEGSAPFTLCKNRDGDPLTSWPATAGSLVLLRAPGLAHIDDGRPLHAVAGPTAGHRISVSFRMDTTAL